MLKKIIEYQGMHLLSKEFVILKVPLSSYANGTSLHEKGKSKHWATFTIGSQEYVVWESLTRITQEKIGNITDLLNESIVNISKEKPDDAYNSEIALILDFAYNQKRLWIKYIRLYQDRYFTHTEIMMYVQMHSLIEAIFGLNEEGHSLKSIYKTFERIKEKFKLYNFKIRSYKYFSDKLKRFRKEGIENAIVNGNKHKRKDGILTSKYITKQVARFYRQNKPVLSYKEIVNKVNHEIGKRGYPDIKIWAVKEICKDAEFQNKNKPFRLGQKWVEENLEPFLVRSLPRDANDKWEADGTVLPYYTLLNNRVTRLWYVVVVDVFSRKIISWAVGHYETTALVIASYRIAAASTRCLAVEIVHDNSSAYTSQKASELEAEFEALGCLVRPTHPDNPRDKGTVEKVLDIMHCTQFNQYPEAFLGDRWNTNREEFRMAPVYLKELKKKRNVKTPNQIIQMVSESVNRYNNTIF